MVQLAQEGGDLVRSDYSEVSRALRSLLSDSNALVVSRGAAALGALGGKLGRDFRDGARRAGGLLLEKGGDKDKRVLEAVHVALRNFLEAGCLLPQEVTPSPSSPPAASLSPLPSALSLLPSSFSHPFPLRPPGSHHFIV